MTYVGLGQRTVIASVDKTGLNAGNYTCAFADDVLTVSMPYFEIYHMVVENVIIGASAKIVINNQPWGFVNPLSGAEWNPPQPIQMNHGDEIDFLWSIAASGQAPQVTVWMRYDPSIPANARVAPAAFLCLAHGQINWSRW